MLAPILEEDSRTGDKVSDSRGDEHLTRCRKGGYPGTGMDGDSRDLIPEQLTFARVNTDSKLEPEGVHGVTDGDSATDRARRSIEGRKEAVAGGVDLPPAEALQLTPHGHMVAFEQVHPALITECEGSLSRPDDVSDQDGGKNTVRVLFTNLKEKKIKNNRRKKNQNK